MGYGNGGATTGGDTYGTPANDIPRVPLIVLEMNRQAEAVDQLHSLIADLDVRISGILRPDPQIQSAGPPTPVGAHPVALATVLFDQNAQLEVACRRLQSMLDRVEL